MFWKKEKDEKLRKDLEETRERLESLEKDYHSLILTMQNLQSAILAMSRSQDAVSQDVRAIQDMVAHFLHELDPNQLGLLYMGGKGDDSLN